MKLTQEKKATESEVNSIREELRQRNADKETVTSHLLTHHIYCNHCNHRFHHQCLLVSRQLVYNTSSTDISSTDISSIMTFLAEIEAGVMKKILYQ